MKRIHIHIGVENIDDSVRFYSALFNAEPSKVKLDYAKWMLEDPCVNFAISTRVGVKGLDHLGIQVDDMADLDGIRSQMSAANISTHDDGETTCCYAKSEKSWVKDPDGVAWEAYQTMEDVQVFSEKEINNSSSCCVIEDDEKSGCC
ncbi:MAG: ArsI/CadI family heavy metal resistance metalloenzyme [Alphaproteobacteria bacterium]